MKKFAAFALGFSFLISLEPEGGAPAGKSMGPVMFAGLLVKQTP